MWLYCQITYSLISKNESNTINIITQLIVKNLTWFFKSVISVNFGAFTQLPALLSCILTSAFRPYFFRSSQSAGISKGCNCHLMSVICHVYFGCRSDLTIRVNLDSGL